MNFRCVKLVKGLEQHCVALHMDVKLLIIIPVLKKRVNSSTVKVNFNGFTILLFLGCSLKEEQFLICCSKHRGTVQS